MNTAPEIQVSNTERMLGMLQHQVSLALGVLAIVGAALTFMDSRHASAADVTALTAAIQASSDAIQASEVSQLEYRIKEVERRTKRILRIHVDERTVFERDELVDLLAYKEHLLRELSRLEGSM